MNDQPDEGYDGPAELLAGEGGPARAVHVDVTLRGGFQPIDGRYHWYGRVARNDVLEELGAGATVAVRTPDGEATGKLSDLDPWGRYRVSGTGPPPFATAVEPAAD